MKQILILFREKGESYGMEFIIRFNNHFAAFTGSYALSWTYRDIKGWISHPKYDSRHNVNLNLNFDFGSGWHSGLSWFFNSGLPFTQIMGFYDKLYFETLFNTGLYGYYLPYSVLADKNLGRLPTYHRLDLNITKKFQIYFTNVELSFSIMNVYDRKNIFYFERDTGERVNMIPFLPTATIKIEI
jgi:outer membrane receptor for Fe3+-dicitrate